MPSVVLNDITISFGSAPNPFAIWLRISCVLNDNRGSRAISVL